MPGMSAQNTNMGTEHKETTRYTDTTRLLNGHVTTATHKPTRRSVTMEDEDRIWTANRKAAFFTGSNLTRSGSVKDLIFKFSGSSSDGQNTPDGSPASLKVKGHELAEGTKIQETENIGKMKRQDKGKSGHQNSEPKIQDPAQNHHSTDKKTEQKIQHSKDEKHAKDTPQLTTDGHAARVSGPQTNYNGEKQHTPLQSEDEPAAPRVRQNPKYQLYLGSNGPVGSNGSNGTGGSNGSVRESVKTNGGANGNLSRVSAAMRGSMESLSSRDWDSSSDKTAGFESPPRSFNSPYATLSLDYTPVHRMSDYKNQEVMSPTVNEMNVFTMTRSVSPGHSPVLGSRSRLSNYETLTRRREATPSQLIRSNQPNKRDFIQELTNQLEECRRRNQFLEAESIEMDKERNQIRFEMRGLLVNNEDLLRTNTQMQGEINRLREKIVELESSNNVMIERFKETEKELKEAREVMVEANNQEYAFNFLQQTLKNKIQDAEEALEKQTQHSQTLSEKLWLAERNLEELEVEKETKAKKALEFSNTVFRLETELADALQDGNQAKAELSLQQKLRADAQLRVEELEESVLEKDQELLRLTQIVTRLQGEVSDKLSDKEQTLEEEIQLRERVQLQCKQAERTVEDLRMELQTLSQSKDDLCKQLKQAQETIIDLEAEVEELQENEQRWTSKHKRALDQNEQIQLKLIQEKDLNDQLECEKVILERQLRDLRIEIDELQNNRVEVDSITRAECKAKELENTLRTEERNKVVLTNTIGKLERKIQELTEQIEEEHKISTEQRDLMTQRIRSLKRQLNEVEEEASRRDVQLRHTQRELADEREANSKLQRQLLDQHLQIKRKESRQTLENLKLDLSVDEEKEEEEQKVEDKTEDKPTEKQVTQV